MRRKGTARSAIGAAVTIQDEGRVRALARLLRAAGQQLVDAAGTAASRARSVGSTAADTAASGEDSFECSGDTLLSVAEAMLHGQWEELEALVCAARTRCGTLLDDEHLGALGRAVRGVVGTTAAPLPSGAATGAAAALSALGRGFERRAESFTDSASAAGEAISEALFGAAGALRSAARLFAMTSAAPTPPRAAAASPLELLEEIEKRMASTPEDAGAWAADPLRALARHFHPDRNPGREAEVLPAFHRVQALRAALSQRRR